MIRGQSQTTEGDEFGMTQFESSGNQMKGTFKYKDLEQRLRKIRQKIDDETQSWITNGAKAFANHDRVALNLHFQFGQCKQHFSTNPNGITLDFEMEKDNPFVWTMVGSFLI